MEPMERKLASEFGELRKWARLTIDEDCYFH